jgi:hypothetical protein
MWSLTEHAFDLDDERGCVRAHLFWLAIYETMAPKSRFIDLKLSGRKLDAPAEGYTPRSEARIKRWLTQVAPPASPTSSTSSNAIQIPEVRGKHQNCKCSSMLFNALQCSSMRFNAV